ncbi:MAG TPA: GerMN domain-containing protein [Candidatus Limiplasma sp.]|nr:GerMN domain-containing protein [Candidatus Limiplasma sp.]HRX08138.1 GerMN domain-containing protein [Candidatus Limiplasma sp.]
MKHKTRLWIFALIVLLPLLLSGCYEQLNPLEKNAATPAPGLSVELFTAAADDSNTDVIKATLYFRYLDEPMLAAESRLITVRRDQRPEQAIVEALLQGPSAGNADLRRMIPADAQVEAVSNNGQVLFVTFSEKFLSDDIPVDWATSEGWSTEAPLIRKLIIQSVVASVTESYPYTGVQFLVHRRNEVQTSLRLGNEYFLDGSVGLSEPMVRDEALLLTPQSTVKTILYAWAQKDYEQMYKYIAQADKPAYSAFVETLDRAPDVDVLSISGGSVYLDGQTAVVTVYIRLLTDMEQEQLLSYPLQLVRENGVWKMKYARLTALIPET